MLKWVLAALTFIPAATHPFGPQSTIYNLTGSEPAFTPAALVLNDDGSVWLSSLGGNRLAHATSEGKLTIVQLPAPYSKSQIESITRDMSGNLWFTETQSYDGSHNYIGKMTQAGHFTFYPIRRNNAFLMGIAAAPNGGIWFTEYGADRAGRILPSGRITEFYLGRGAFPQTIAAGPDGNLWTTGMHCVVRISPSGQMKRIIVPIDGQYRNIQSSGSALWMTVYGTNALVRIAPSGTVKEFQVTSGRFGIIHLDPGPTGTLLGTDMNAGAIMQLSDDGKLRPVVTLGANAVADHAVVTPQGRIWFTLSEYNAYGHAP